MSSKVCITVCLVTVATKWNIWNPVFPDIVGFFCLFYFYNLGIVVHSFSLSTWKA